MRCGLNNSLLPAHTDTHWTPVTPTTDDVIDLTSIVISRGHDEVIATITDYMPATAMADLGQVIVSGDVTGMSGDNG